MTYQHYPSSTRVIPLLFETTCPNNHCITAKLARRSLRQAAVVTAPESRASAWGYPALPSYIKGCCNVAVLRNLRKREYNHDPSLSISHFFAVSTRLPHEPLKSDHLNIGSNSHLTDASHWCTPALCQLPPPRPRPRKRLKVATALCQQSLAGFGSEAS